jgi:hypothetical protein
MDFAPIYLIERFFYRFGDFFRHWYIDGSLAFKARFFLTAKALRLPLTFFLAIPFIIFYFIWLAIPVIIIFYATRIFS